MAKSHESAPITIVSVKVMAPSQPLSSTRRDGRRNYSDNDLRIHFFLFTIRNMKHDIETVAKKWIDTGKTSDQFKLLIKREKPTGPRLMRAKAILSFIQLREALKTTDGIPDNVR